MNSLPLSLTPSWSLMVVTGAGLFFVLAGREGIRRGLPPAELFAALALGTLGALAGARLGTLDPVQGVTSGRTILGVIAGTVVGFAAAARWLRLSRGSVDTMAVAAPVGIAVGRIGCIVAGCCRGRPTKLPWGVAPRKDLPSDEILHAGVHLHPVQAYEAILVALLALVLYRVAPRTGSRPGLLFTLFVAGYGAVRWGTEFFRYRSDLVLGHSGPQAVAGLAAVAAAILAWRLWSRGPVAPGSRGGSAASPTGLGAPVLISLPLLVVIFLGLTLAPWERLILVGVSALGVWGLAVGRETTAGPQARAAAYTGFGPACTAPVPEPRSTPLPVARTLLEHDDGVSILENSAEPEKVHELDRVTTCDASVYNEHFRPLRILSDPGQEVHDAVRSHAPQHPRHV